MGNVVYKIQPQRTIGDTDHRLGYETRQYAVKRDGPVIVGQCSHKY